jgi:hypothetical protein
MFYANIWDPYLIIFQLLVLQSGFYLIVGSWLILFSAIFGQMMELNNLLGQNAMEITTQQNGWITIAAYALTAPPL